ncbi:hypothetical protein Acr_15g0003710 [Actinidia rufa]|uniref:Isopenicillin N synthase-like Fe(2+) 2OG dioxygenase domain-containing protein n=1 Tax=Actinidia rufa TaxID=165716 RepID=A0A7J0FSS7_9ERIC|nr:hypothetical protein Acr_15g0003710 [Actinidia rufa]
MDGEYYSEIPFLDFSGAVALDSSDSTSEAWKQELRGKVREACENHGCFLVEYNNNTKQVQWHWAFRPLLMLPFSSIHESFGIEDPHRLDMARSFTNLMWPANGNPSFCEVLNSMSSKMLELSLMIMKMVLESLEMECCYGFLEDNKSSSSTFRLIKYKVAPTPSNIEHPATSNIGLIPHTDKNFLTILCQNEVQGLEVLSRESGNWVQLMIPPRILRHPYRPSVSSRSKHSVWDRQTDRQLAWSNGKLHAAKHRVMMRGDKERFSCGLFLSPKEDATIEVPQTLVDKDHPLLYRPFTYSDFLNFYSSNIFSDDALHLFAAI